MLRHRLIALSLLLAVSGSSFLPAFAKPAQAQFGFSVVSAPVLEGLVSAQTALQVGVETKNVALRVAKVAAMVAARAMIDHIVASTVKWAQSGFDGNPAYVTNPGEYFGNIADGVAGEFIKGSDLGLLCSPFQASIKLSLTAQYYEPRPFQCTLTGVIGNIENFYGDFSQGGWDAWFTMTQQPTNNPYGAYLKAKIELDSQLASAIGATNRELEWTQGFLSWKKCAIGTTPKYDIDGNVIGEMCVLGQEKTVTPGSVISEQLNQALPAGLNKLINAQDVDQVIGAFAAGLLKRYVFGPKGLFNNDPYNGEEGNEITGLLPNNGEGEGQCGAPLPPPPGSAPNESGIVSEVAAEFPELLATSALNYDFLDKVVERLHAIDPNWGYNGKRGDLNNISQDAISYYAGDVRSVFIFDIITGHGGPNPQPAWQDVTAETYNCGTTGGYVYPRPNNSSSGEPSEPVI